MTFLDPILIEVLSCKPNSTLEVNPKKIFFLRIFIHNHSNMVFKRTVSCCFVSNIARLRGVFGALSNTYDGTFRDSLWRIFFKTGVLKNFAKFKEKHLCWSLF